MKYAERRRSEYGEAMEKQWRRMTMMVIVPVVLVIPTNIRQRKENVMNLYTPFVYNVLITTEICRQRTICTPTDYSWYNC